MIGAALLGMMLSTMKNDEQKKSAHHFNKNSQFNENHFNNFGGGLIPIFFSLLPQQGDFDVQNNHTVTVRNPGADLQRNHGARSCCRFKGFFMYSRTGLDTEYLGEEWFELTNICTDYAETLGLEAWLYDEDRWPSGTAGGMVTSNPAFSLHFMRCTVYCAGGTDVKPDDFDWDNPVKLQGVREPELVAVFAADADGINFTNAVRITRQTPRDSYSGKTLFVFNTERQNDSSFYNGHTYVDTMNRDATDYYTQNGNKLYFSHCCHQRNNKATEARRSILSVTPCLCVR